MSGLPTELIYLYGGSFVGNFLTAVCFGAITVQVWRYFEIFRRDGIWTRGIVLFLWVVEFFQLVCVTQAMWYYLIAGYGDALRMLVATWQFSVYQIGSVTSSATVQTFFAYRVYSLSNNIWFGAIVELFAVVQCGFGIAVSVSANRILDFATFVEEDTWLTLAWLAMQAAADLVICFAMVYLLKQRRTGFRNTDNILNVMTVWTINTGVATAIISLIILVAFARAGFHFVVLTFGLPLGGFYTFTMMANLHSRTKIAQLWTTTHGPSSMGTNIHVVPQSWAMSKIAGKKSPRNGSQSDIFAASGVRSEPGGAVVIDVIREQEIAYEDGYTHAYIPPHNPSYGSRAGNQRTQTVAFPTDGDY